MKKFLKYLQDKLEYNPTLDSLLVIATTLFFIWLVVCVGALAIHTWRYFTGL